jgi:hypothetical protein
LVQKCWALQQGVTLTFHLVQKIGPVNSIPSETGLLIPSGFVNYPDSFSHPGLSVVLILSLAGNHLLDRVGQSLRRVV